VSAERPRYGEARQALLKAVVAVVSRVGLRGLTYRAVAAEAGVSHGAVSLHFGSRERLVEEALAMTAARAVSLASLERHSERTEEFVDDLTAAVVADEDSFAFQFELALESRRDPELRRPIKDLYDLYQRAIQSELTGLGVGRDPALDRLVLAALEGLIFQQIVGVGEQDEIEASLTRLRRLLAAAVADEAQGR